MCTRDRAVAADVMIRRADTRKIPYHFLLRV